jgi:GNAT superfamily N-acetyltransferase
MGQHAFRQAFRLTQEMVQDWSGEVARHHGLQEFRVFLTPTDDLRLALIVVPEQARCAGIGSAALGDLCDLADSWGRRVVLSPAESGGAYGTTSRERLERFYSRFGFREADDDARDATMPDAMVRAPRRAAVARPEGRRADAKP